MINVTFVSQSGDALGGAEQSLALLIQALPPDIRASAILFGAGEFERRLRDLGVSVTVVELPGTLMSTTRERPATPGLLSVPRSIFTLSRTIAKLDADLVYTNTVKAHVIGSAAARMAGRPAVAHLRDLLEGAARFAVRAVLRGCTVRRIAISRAVRDAFALPATEVIPNPLDLSAYASLPTQAQARRSLSLPESGRLVSIIGRINRWKGHDRFVRIAGLVRSDENVHFAIVGDAIFRDADFVGELREEVKARHLDGRVSFVPWIDDPRLAYAASDVVCNCSHNEPFGRTLIEAAACGVPSICFAGGGTADAVIAGQTGIIIDEGPNAEASFAGALDRMLRDEQLRSRMGAAARTYAKQFDANAHAKRVADVVRSTVRCA